MEVSTIGVAERAAGVVLTVAVVLGLASCGGGDDSDDRAEARSAAAAVKRLQQDFVHGDVNALCRGMTKAAADQAGSVAHGVPRTCPRDLRRAFGVIRKAGGWQHAGAPTVERTEVDGDSATVRVALGAAWSADVPLVREDGRWKLDSFFGTPAASLHKGPSPISDGGGAVEVLDRLGGGEPCFGLSGSYPEVGGGCEIRLSTQRIELAILTLFGDFNLARCWMSYRVASDAAGRTWTYDVSIEGESGTACGDVEPCERRALEPLPWRGKLYANAEGDLLHHVDACLETCIGDYQGELATELVRQGSGWRAETIDAPVGTSGFKFDGRLRVDANGVELRAMRDER